MITGRFFRFSFPFTAVQMLLLPVLCATLTASASDDFLSSRAIIGKNADGQLEVFRLDDDGRLFHKWRKPSDGGWSSWCSLDGSVWPGLAI
ncbi:MAG TPA: hypothetical protein VGY56_19120, partial [Verrucomicrobiae bacterium]|nr:hypothetical protein [Verrucomicrobiae bacterium]